MVSKDTWIILIFLYFLRLVCDLACPGEYFMCHWEECVFFYTLGKNVLYGSVYWVNGHYVSGNAIQPISLLSSVVFLLIFSLNDPSIINSGIFLYCFCFSLRSVSVGFVYLHFLMLGAYIEYICNNMGYRVLLNYLIIMSPVMVLA